MESSGHFRLLDLPNEILDVVFQHVDAAELPTVMLVCRRFHSAAGLTLYRSPSISTNRLSKFTQAVETLSHYAAAVRHFRVRGHYHRRDRAIVGKDLDVLRLLPNLHELNITSHYTLSDARRDRGLGPILESALLGEPGCPFSRLRTCKISLFARRHGKRNTLPYIFESLMMLLSLPQLRRLHFRAIPNPGYWNRDIPKTSIEDLAPLDHLELRHCQLDAYWLEAILRTRQVKALTIKNYPTAGAKDHGYDLQLHQVLVDAMRPTARTLETLTLHIAWEIRQEPMCLSEFSHLKHLLIKFPTYSSFTVIGVDAEWFSFNLPNVERWYIKFTPRPQHLQRLRRLIKAIASRRDIIPKLREITCDFSFRCAGIADARDQLSGLGARAGIKIHCLVRGSVKGFEEGERVSEPDSVWD